MFLLLLRFCFFAPKSQENLYRFRLSLSFHFWHLWCWRRLLRVPWTARSSNQSILKVSPEYSLEGLCWHWNSNTLATWCEELTNWKRPWCWWLSDWTELLIAKGKNIHLHLGSFSFPASRQFLIFWEHLVTFESFRHPFCLVSLIWHPWIWFIKIRFHVFHD